MTALTLGGESDPTSSNPMMQRLSNSCSCSTLHPPPTSHPSLILPSTLLSRLIIIPAPLAITLLVLCSSISRLQALTHLYTLLFHPLPFTSQSHQSLSSFQRTTLIASSSRQTTTPTNQSCQQYRTSKTSSATASRRETRTQSHRLINLPCLMSTPSVTTIHNTMAHQDSKSKGIMTNMP